MTERTLEPVNPSTNDIWEFLGSPIADIDDLEKDDEPRSLARALQYAKSNKEISSAMQDLANVGEFDVEAIDQEGLRETAYWGQARAIYINVGHLDAATIIYDVRDKVFYFETLSNYLEFIEPMVWEVRYAMEDEAGNVMTLYLSVEADSEEDAIEHFVYLVEGGDEAVWGDDPDFDLGSVERTEPKNTKPQNQMWYITGLGEVDEDEEDGMPETLTKVISFGGVEEVSKGEGRGEVVSAY